MTSAFRTPGVAVLFPPATQLVSDLRVVDTSTLPTSRLKGVIRRVFVFAGRITCGVSLKYFHTENLYLSGHCQFAMSFSALIHDGIFPEPGQRSCGHPSVSNALEFCWQWPHISHSPSFAQNWPGPPDNFSNAFFPKGAASEGHPLGLCPSYWLQSLCSLHVVLVPDNNPKTQ